ncbi:hypothetical protein AVEN_183966-1 [Araneus ventricosus]|uniref:DUF4817 domain-containing protein n=1 Tax=Araneus ventricosus TaxID=182803 RepID=A0A4Y2E0F7_ARAVE|nr:hypothetical protein AVEN_183966-1 [Araneus ventricosus]
MRNAAPILESEALVTSTRTHNSQIFEALTPQFLFREQWLLVGSLLSHGSGVSPFQDNQQWLHRFPGSNQQWRLRLVVSKGGSAAKEFRRMKQIRRGPMFPCAQRKMIQKFETTQQLGIIPGRGQKQIPSSSVEDEATAVFEASSQSPHDSVSVPVIPVYCISRIPLSGKYKGRF